LDENNAARKERSRALVKELLEADDNAQPLAPCVYVVDEAAGMLGLIAGALAEKLDGPVAVLRRSDGDVDRLSGSGRVGLATVNLLAVAESLEGVVAAGHAQACGFRVDDAGAAERLAKALGEVWLIAQADLPPSDDSWNAGLIFGEHPLADVAQPENAQLLDLCDMINRWGPFGHGWPEPTHLVRVNRGSVKFTSMSDGKHTRIVTPWGLSLVWWSSADGRDQLVALADDAVIDFEVALAKNTYRDETVPQGVVRSVSHG
jgi:single-stranded DNA-specific DHH superfamily exonuclease